MDAHFAVSFQANTSEPRARRKWPGQIRSGRRGSASRLRTVGYRSQETATLNGLANSASLRIEDLTIHVGIGVVRWVCDDPSGDGNFEDCHG